MYSEWTYHIHQINNTVHCWLHIHVQLQGCTRLYTNPNYKAAQGCANCIFLAPGISPSNGGWGCLRKIQLLGKYQYKSHVKMKNHNPNQRAPMCFIQDLSLDVAAAYKKQICIDDTWLCFHVIVFHEIARLVRAQVPRNVGCSHKQTQQTHVAHFCKWQRLIGYHWVIDSRNVCWTKKTEKKNATMFFQLRSQGNNFWDTRICISFHKSTDLHKSSVSPITFLLCFFSGFFIRRGAQITMVWPVELAINVLSIQEIEPTAVP